MKRLPSVSLLLMFAACSHAAPYTAPTHKVIPQQHTDGSSAETKGGETTELVVSTDEPPPPVIETTPPEIETPPPDPTCDEAVAHLLSVMVDDHSDPATLIDQCHYDRWSLELRQCYVDFESAEQVGPCDELLARDVAAAIREDLGVTFTAAAAAERCYAGGAGADADCREACADGFAEACHRLGEHPRACDLGVAIKLTVDPHNPLDPARRRSEIEAAQQSCEVVAEPLVDAAVAGDAGADTSLYSYAADACRLALHIGSDRVGEACREMSFAATLTGAVVDMFWGLDVSCQAGDEQSCDMLGGMWDGLGDLDIWPGL